jgi:hypothetical protein
MQNWLAQRSGATLHRHAEPIGRWPFAELDTWLQAAYPSREPRWLRPIWRAISRARGQHGGRYWCRYPHGRRGFWGFAGRFMNVPNPD